MERYFLILTTMGLFGKKEINVIGVDIGTSSIKLIELQKKDGNVELVTYGFVDHFEGEILGIERQDTTAIAHFINQIYQKSQCSTSSAIAALPTYSVFTSLMTLPAMKKEELDSAIHWEAKKIIPLPLEEIVLDYRILNAPPKKGGLGISVGKKKKEEPKEGEDQPQYKILVTGASREMVNRYTEIFQKSGLTLKSLETEMFAIARALVGDDTGEHMIVEIGAATTDLIIVENAVPFLGRSIESGGYAMTRAIMNSLNINQKRAEQLKRDIGLLSYDESAGAGGVPDILKSSIEPILHEIRYTLDLYRDHAVKPSEKATGVIEKIILTGGTALLPGIADYFSKVLDMRVVLGDPWERVHYQQDLKPLLATIGPKFSVSIGLALREVL
jgi:type IV pilus assembly protein PilM